jgi:serine/threonine protein kinase
MTSPLPPLRGARLDEGGPFPGPFGNYILLMPFARGGMGEVYLAKRGAILGAEKYCVLKKLRPDLMRDREHVARFIDEARIVVQLSHANIAQVFDVGRVGTEYYLAMEYVAGRDARSLHERARDKGHELSEAAVLYLLGETLAALDYAHRRSHPMTGEPLNLVHRDVSPQNIMVSFDGEVKLIDFGLASSRLKVERTQPNVVMGKMAYMAPEQARGDAIDPRADLFAAAVVGYELLAGERYYEGWSANDIWQVVGRGGFVPGRWGQLSLEVQALLGKALDPSPDERFATCAELRDAIMVHLHTQHPGRGERSLRDAVQLLFASDIARERDLLAGFGEVNVEVLQESLESTRSQSISLASAGSSGAGEGARVVHDERTQASGPKPQTVATMTETGSGEGEGAHDDVTLLGPAPAAREPRARTRTPPTGTVVPGHGSGASRFPGNTQPYSEAEHTTVLARARHKELEPARSQAPARLAGALLVLALLGGGAALLWAKRSPDTLAKKPEPAPAVASGLRDRGLFLEHEPPDKALREPAPADEPVLAEAAALPDHAAPVAKQEPEDTRESALDKVRARRQPKARGLPLRKPPRAPERLARPTQAAPLAAAPEPEPKQHQPQPQPQPQPKRPPKESFAQQVRIVLSSGLSGECSKSAIAQAWTTTQHMSAEEHRAFEGLVSRCRRQCR